MNSSLLIISIIFYILSLAGALIIVLATKKLPPTAIRIPAFVHTILLAAFVLVSLFNFNSLMRNYLAIATFVSALSISIWALKNTFFRIPLKIYFGLYLLSLPVFLISPSRVFYFVCGNSYLYIPEQKFLLKDNYYLLKQQSLFQANNSDEHYKLIRKIGIYNKTIQRDISFTHQLDSTLLLQLTLDSIRIRGYYTFNGTVDSLDTGFVTGENQKRILQQKRQ